jgi:hypothetical protein
MIFTAQICMFSCGSLYEDLENKKLCCIEHCYVKRTRKKIERKKPNYEKELRKSMNKGSVGKILFMSM